MYVDIHSHILPEMDDGAVDTAEALEMLKLAAFDWTNHIVATPHFKPLNTSVVVRAKTDELAAQAAFYNINIIIHPGAEVLITPDIPELLASGDISSINGSRYILVEFPLLKVPKYAPEVLYQIQLIGLIPIIAHPERYSEVMGNIGFVRNFIDSGMLVQVNAGSLTGMFGQRIHKTAMKLIKSGMVHFVASDAHSCNGRSPEMGKAAGIVEKKFGREMMQQLFYFNGMAVIENRAIQGDWYK